MYYDDALIAAYMAKHFKVKYIDENKKKLNYCHLGFYYQDKNGVDVVGYTDIEFYIHPDSLSVFDPMEDDLVEFDGICSGLVIAVLDETVGIQNDDVVYEIAKEDCSIVQRNGKPFFTPLKEK